MAADDLDPVRRRLDRWTIGLMWALFAAAALFLVWPEADIQAMRLLYRGDGEFLFSGDPYLQAVREVLYKGLMAALVALLLRLLARRLIGLTLFPFPERGDAFLLLFAVLWPGLIANALFKNHWGRARPSATLPFGGEHAFTPPLLVADECQRNCSFVAGESSFATVLVAAALLFAGRRRPLLAAAVVWLALVGFLRMSVGAHFLSDVLIASLGGALLAVAGYRHLVLPRRAPAASAAPAPAPAPAPAKASGGGSPAAPPH